MQAFLQIFAGMQGERRICTGQKLHRPGTILVLIH